MKIDYELVEKIGATHYCDKTHRFYRANNTLLVFTDGNWSLSDASGINALLHIKPIPPKPPVRVEYEKVTDSIFDLRPDFEAGELYVELLGNSGEYRVIEEESTLIDEMSDDNIYRRIEKPVDWRDEVNTFVHCKKAKHMGYEVNDVCMSDDCFLEMCRVALRANGEL